MTESIPDSGYEKETYWLRSGYGKETYWLRSGYGKETSVMISQSIPETVRVRIYA